MSGYCMLLLLEYIPSDMKITGPFVCLTNCAVIEQDNLTIVHL